MKNTAVKSGSSLSYCTLTDGETYQVYSDSNKASLVGSFVFYNVSLNLKSGVTVNLADCTAEYLLTQVLADGMTDRLGDGIELNALKELFENLVEQMVKYSDGSGFNAEAFDRIVRILERIPSIDSAKITLGRAPTDAGIYMVNAICTDPGYLLSVGVGVLTILPLSKNVELKFSESSVLEKASADLLLFKLPLAGVYQVSYYDFRSDLFDSVCGATLSYKGETVEDAEFTVTYTGLSDDFKLTLLDSKGKPSNSGTYIQTISVKGNYSVLPITRTIKVLPADVVIEAADKQSFTYDGKAHAVNYKAYFDEESRSDVPAEEMTVSYKPVSGSGLLSALRKLVTRSSTAAPTEKGSYEVTISYNGNSGVKKTVSMTIN